MTRPASAVAASTRSASLERAHLEVLIRDLTAVYAVSYHFHNARDVAIEAQFIFPVPADAAFIGLEAEIAGERLQAVVVAAAAATRRYDDALGSGDSALLLREIRPGLLGASLGNIAPGERAEFTLRYVRPLALMDRRLRFSLPFALRPRYGEWRGEEVDHPVHDAGARYALSAEIRIEGFLAGARVHCSSHGVAFKNPEGLRLHLPEGSLDGDLVLGFTLPGPPAPVAETFADEDGTGARLTFLLPEAPGATPPPVQVALVLDCSGSMQGEAIRGCRAALLAVVDRLTDSDRLHAIRFGSTVEPMLRRPLRMTTALREALQDLAGLVQADLGGTEMGRAIEAALVDLARVREDGVPQAIILVTDGAVYEEDIARSREVAQKAGVRIFTVAVGTSVGVDVLEPLALATGGRLEQTTPGESIAEAVTRQLRRVRQFRPVPVALEWDEPPETLVTPPETYAGDAVTVAARFAGRPSRVTVSSPALAEPLSLRLASIEADPAHRAWLGLALYRAAPAALREALALRYGLLTPETSAVVVKLRAEGDKLDPLPQVEQVPQMLPRDMFVESSDDMDYGTMASWGPEDCSSAYLAVMKLHASKKDKGIDQHAQDAVELHCPPATSLSRQSPSAPGKVPILQLDPERCTVLFLALRDSMVDALREGTLADIGTLIGRLPEADREDAALLLTRCLKLDLSSPSALAELAIALFDLPWEPKPTPDQETLLAEWLAHGRHSCTSELTKSPNRLVFEGMLMDV
jgi:Ca-activated chloride channel family protein